MSEIQVTTATLISKAEELTQLNEQFKKAVESLKQEEQALRTSYEGESSDAFHAAFTKDSIQMDNFYNAIAQYAQKLQNPMKKQNRQTFLSYPTDRSGLQIINHIKERGIYYGRNFKSYT